MGSGANREQATETAGFYHTVSVNDDTGASCRFPRAMMSARRSDCFLAMRVGERRMGVDKAFELALQLAYHLAKKAYRL